MENSPFAKLPAEITNNIAELALFHKDGVSINDSKFRHASALAQTCKQMRADYTEAFYDLNSFYLHTTDGKSCQSRFTGFARRIGPVNAIAAGKRTVLLSLPVDSLKDDLRDAIWGECCADVYVRVKRADESLLVELQLSYPTLVQSLRTAAQDLTLMVPSASPWEDQLTITDCLLAVLHLSVSIYERDTLEGQRLTAQREHIRCSYCKHHGQS